MSRVPADPHFLQPLKRALVAALATLCVLAMWVRAPLEIAANPAKSPNPAKSAWFLLWIQELVSYDSVTIYAVLGLALALFALPWLPIAPVQHARWFHREHRHVAVATLLVSLAVVGLTLLAVYFRGSDWCFVVPF